MFFRAGFRAEQLMHHIVTGVCYNQCRRGYNGVLSWHLSTASCPTAEMLYKRTQHGHTHGFLPMNDAEDNNPSLMVQVA